MPYDPEHHHRHSIRLPGYDYAGPGAYFVTICTASRTCLFGEILGGNAVLNKCGDIVRHEWLASADIRREIGLDAYVVMPNHIHAIVWIVAQDAVGAHGRAPVQRAPQPCAPLQRAPQPCAPVQRAPQPCAPAQRAPQPCAPVQRAPQPCAPAQRAPQPCAPAQRAPKSLGALMAGYKSTVTKQINILRDMPGADVWQRNYYEHIIRSDRSLDAIRAYIVDNPLRWEWDTYHPSPIGPDARAIELLRLLGDGA
jgi:putative transposase